MPQNPSHFSEDAHDQYHPDHQELFQTPYGLKPEPEDIRQEREKQRQEQEKIRQEQKEALIKQKRMEIQKMLKNKAPEKAAREGREKRGYAFIAPYAIALKSPVDTLDLLKRLGDDGIINNENQVNLEAWKAFWAGQLNTPQETVLPYSLAQLKQGIKNGHLQVQYVEHDPSLTMDGGFPSGMIATSDGYLVGLKMLRSLEKLTLFDFFDTLEEKPPSGSTTLFPKAA